MHRVEAKIAAESAEAQKLATMLGRTGALTAFDSPSSGGGGKNGGGGDRQWARPEGGLRPQAQGKSGAGLSALSASSSFAFGGVASLPELNMLPVAKEQLYSSSSSSSSRSSSSSGGGGGSSNSGSGTSNGALFFAPETTHAGTSTKGRALPKGSGKALVGGGSTAAAR